jgi:transposase
MSQPTTKNYSAEFKERAVKLAVESEQPIAQTARDLGVNENTLHTWIGKGRVPIFPIRLPAKQGVK